MRSGRKCGSNWGCSYFLFKKQAEKLSSVTYFLSHRQADAPVIYIYIYIYPVNTSVRSDICSKNFSLAVLFSSNGNTYTVRSESRCALIKVLEVMSTYHSALQPLFNN
jgi:hypothetical protein